MSVFFRAVVDDVMCHFMNLILGQVVGPLQARMAHELDPVARARHCVSANLISPSSYRDLTSLRDTPQSILVDRLLDMLRGTGNEGYKTFKSILQENWGAMPFHQHNRILQVMLEREREVLKKQVRAWFFVKRHAWLRVFFFVSQINYHIQSRCLPTVLPLPDFPAAAIQTSVSVDVRYLGHARVFFRGQTPPGMNCFSQRVRRQQRCWRWHGNQVKWTHIFLCSFMKSLYHALIHW